MTEDVSRATLIFTRVAAQIEAKRLGRRKRVSHLGTLCSRCLTAAPSTYDTYCAPCRANYQRDWRAKKKLAEGTSNT